jgi:outer membrane immunogenic protein
VKNIIVFLTLGATAMLSATAIAANGYGYGNSNYYDANGFYVGASVGQVFYKEDGIDTLAPSVLNFEFGQKINPFLALEGRVGAGISSDQSNGYSLSIPVMFGGYVKGSVPISPWVSFYGLAGVADTNLHRNYPDYNSNDAGFSVGVGGEFALYGGASIRAEWLLLDSGTNAGYNYNANEVTVGVNWRM